MLYSTSSKENRALEISVENVATGEVNTVYSDNAPNVTSIGSVSLNPEENYIVSFSGVDEAHAKGGDVALFGIWFLKDPKTVGVKEINVDGNAGNLMNGEIFNLNGVKVRNAGQGLGGLKKGVYLINGKKAVVK